MNPVSVFSKKECSWEGGLNSFSSSIPPEFLTIVLFSVNVINAKMKEEKN